MMDDEDWQRHCAEFDALLATHSGRSLPPGTSEAHFALLMARMRTNQAEIDKMFAEARKTPKCGHD
jgi:hypothetical protein